MKHEKIIVIYNMLLLKQFIQTTYYLSIYLYIFKYVKNIKKKNIIYKVYCEGAERTRLNTFWLGALRNLTRARPLCLRVELPGRIHPIFLGSAWNIPENILFPISVFGSPFTIWIFQCGYLQSIHTSACVSTGKWSGRKLIP